MKDPTHPDLFEEEDTPMAKRPAGYIQMLKRRMKYREAEPGEPTCNDCKHLIKERYHGRNYYKCALIGISRSEATDVKLKDTCRKQECP